jgi:fibronectin type 3 domain-containing protein
VVTTAGGSASTAYAYATGLAQPQNFSATASTPNTVQLRWSAVSGATRYDVYRSAQGGPFGLATSTSGPAFDDASVSANSSYLYKVLAFGNGLTSPFSPIDAATTVFFTDPTLAGVAPKSVHITELRTAVNAMRAAAGQQAFNFTDSTLTVGTQIKRAHIAELRSALDAARSAIGLPAINYTDPTLVAGVTMMKAAHIIELRGATQ